LTFFKLKNELKQAGSRLFYSKPGRYQYFSRSLTAKSLIMSENIFTSLQGMHSLLLMHIRHAVKTGLAASMAYIVSSLLGSQFGLWAVVSTLVVMQGLSVADSIQNSLFRFTGMSIGALVGTVVLILTPTNNILVTLEVFLLCCLGEYLTRYGTRYNLAATAACLVLLAGHNFMETGGIKGSALFGLTLSLEVLLGVICAVGVNALLWPIRLGDALRSDIESQFKKCADLVRDVVESYLEDQHHAPYRQLEGLRLQTQSNGERMNKVRTLEAPIYHFEHKGLAVQAEVIESCVHSLGALLDIQDDYEDESSSRTLEAELRVLTGCLLRALRHLGGPDAYTPVPEITRTLTLAVADFEARLEQARRAGEISRLSLHRALQLYSLYQTLRRISEDLLGAMYQLQVLGEKPLLKKSRLNRQAGAFLDRFRKKILTYRKSSGR
jgi:uncharacterized membrane protein YgaE (UPF0421/DUF939 family)